MAAAPQILATQGAPLVVHSPITTNYGDPSNLFCPSNSSHFSKKELIQKYYPIAILGRFIGQAVQPSQGLQFRCNG
jgi:hypothetical protein